MMLPARTIARICCSVSVLMASVFLLSAAQYAWAQEVPKTRRAVTLDDFFSLEDVGRYFGGPLSIASDRQAVAFARLRSQKKMKDFALQFCGAGRARIYGCSGIQARRRCS